jgi:glycosyltransferase involved in cell wall biosynthesis
MLMLLTDASTRTQFQERGLKNAKRFSWAQTAEKTLALYQCLLQDPQIVPRR